MVLNKIVLLARNALGLKKINYAKKNNAWILQIMMIVIT